VNYLSRLVSNRDPPKSLGLQARATSTLKFFRVDLSLTTRETLSVSVASPALILRGHEAAGVSPEVTISDGHSIITTREDLGQRNALTGLQ
jgi:hypothetical protein